jgi:hypothetical protein
MTDENLLVILKPGDEKHFLFVNFLQSIPDEAKKIFDSFGYIGSLERNLAWFKRERMRHFVIFRSPAFNNLANDYFSSTDQASVNKIKDNLIVEIEYKQQDTDIVTGARLITKFDGTIDEMINKYEELALTSPKELLTKGLNEQEFLRDNITKNEWFGFGKNRKIVPTYISIGIETPDRKYLLRSTGALGPYVGRLLK